MLVLILLVEHVVNNTAITRIISIIIVILKYILIFLHLFFTQSWEK